MAVILKMPTDLWSYEPPVVVELFGSQTVDWGLLCCDICLCFSKMSMSLLFVSGLSVFLIPFNYTRMLCFQMEFNSLMLTSLQASNFLFRLGEKNPHPGPRSFGFYQLILLVSCGINWNHFKDRLDHGQFTSPSHTETHKQTSVPVGHPNIHA